MRTPWTRTRSAKAAVESLAGRRDRSTPGKWTPRFLSEGCIVFDSSWVRGGVTLATFFCMPSVFVDGGTSFKETTKEEKVFGTLVVSAIRAYSECLPLNWGGVCSLDLGTNWFNPGGFNVWRTKNTSPFFWAFGCLLF